MSNLQQRIENLSPNQRKLLARRLSRLGSRPATTASSSSISSTSQQLVAYIVPTPASQTTSRELQAALKQALPDYMIPTTFVTLETLPLTPNGKIDRQALPEPEQVATQREDFVAPQSDIEQKLADIWGEILGLNSVGVNDNFFDLGGNSLLIVQLISQVRVAFNMPLTVRTVFDTPTIAELARHIEVMQWAAQTDSLPAEATSEEREEFVL